MSEPKVKRFPLTRAQALELLGLTGPTSILYRLEEGGEPAVFIGGAKLFVVRSDGQQQCVLVVNEEDVDPTESGSRERAVSFQPQSCLSEGEWAQLHPREADRP